MDSRPLLIHTHPLRHKHWIQTAAQASWTLIGVTGLTCPTFEVSSPYNRSLLFWHPFSSLSFSAAVQVEAASTEKPAMLIRVLHKHAQPAIAGNCWRWHRMRLLWLRGIKVLPAAKEHANLPPHLAHFPCTPYQCAPICLWFCGGSRAHPVLQLSMAPAPSPRTGTWMSRSPPVQLGAGSLGRASDGHERDTAGDWRWSLFLQILVQQSPFNINF